MGMLFTETKIQGAFVVTPEEFKDARGLLGRSFSATEFERHGLDPRVVECNVSFSEKQYTVRGMHLQKDEQAQAKLVRCTKGAIFDVILDLRPGSRTFKQWWAEELTDENRLMLYVPKGCAHGFQTLEHGTEVFYQMSQAYHRESEAGVRWNDPAFGIEWRVTEGITINERDATYPDFRL
jgi:dTDP-4-dehydrorhamnose 3,5-epimerase